MIKYTKVTAKGVQLEQIAFRPFVYLDNWALNLFTTDHTHGGKFTILLNKLEGTLAISIINLMEVVRRSDEKQVSSILSFIDSVDQAFIETNPIRVIEREKNLQKVGIPVSQGSPWSGRALLKAYFLYAHSPLKPFKLSEAFWQLQKAFKDGYSIQENFEEELFSIIKKARSDKVALSKAENRFKNKKRIRTEYPYTEDLLSRCIDFIAINKTMKMPNKEWRDVFQVIIPVAYCDFVLIDSRWVEFVQSTGLKTPDIAKVYNQNKVEKFLDDLRKFSK